MHSDLTTEVVIAAALYSFAEHQAGHASTIWVAAAGSTFSVSDNGRGHSIDRLVGQTSYLSLVYTHLDYPFGAEQAAPVQLQGIGMSLINTLCAELSVKVKKPHATLTLSFRDGVLKGRELVQLESAETGNTVSGTIHPRYQASSAHSHSLERRLRGLLAASATLRLFFNGLPLHADA